MTKHQSNTDWADHSLHFFPDFAVIAHMSVEVSSRTVESSEGAHSTPQPKLQEGLSTTKPKSHEVTLSMTGTLSFTAT